MQGLKKYDYGFAALYMCLSWNTQT